MTRNPVAATSGDLTVPTYSELLRRDDAPPGSSWGVFGANYEYGTLNFLTPSRVAAAAACVTRGVTFNLDYPIDAFEGPIRARKVASHTVYNLGKKGTVVGPVEELTGAIDDYLDAFYPQKSSHVDGLRHVVHVDHGLYNGVAREEIRAGVATLGIGRFAERGIAGRGVLVDVARFRRRLGRPLDHRTSDIITVSDLELVLEAEGVTLRPGDMLMIRTECPAHLWKNADDDDAAYHNAGLEGSSETAGWLWDNKIALVAADNLAVEATPVVGLGKEGLHPRLLPLLGMPLGELWQLDALAADSAKHASYECLLVVKPLNITGGVASPANATAIR